MRYLVRAPKDTLLDGRDAVFSPLDNDERQSLALPDILATSQKNFETLDPGSGGPRRATDSW